MPRRCLVCDHPAREQIDAALAVRNASFSAIARTHSVSRDSIARHCAEHLPKALQAVSRDVEAWRGERIADSVHWLEREARRLSKLAEDEGDLRTALAGLAQVKGAVELRAKLAGELQEGSKVGVVIVLPPEDKS
jgi:hypothetical protein